MKIFPLHLEISIFFIRYCFFGRRLPEPLRKEFEDFLESYSSSASTATTTSSSSNENFKLLPTLPLLLTESTLSFPEDDTFEIPLLLSAKEEGKSEGDVSVESTINETDIEITVIKADFVSF